MDHVCAIQEDDTLNCWGANDHNQADPPSGTFSEIEAGFHFNCGLKTDGTIACWGRDTAGKFTRYKLVIYIFAFSLSPLFKAVFIQSV
ncbi:MAG: RCC1 domain-containing protein [Pseudomonadota bacterium]